MNNILSDANIFLHKEMKSDDSPFVIRRRGDLLHLCIGSNGCRFQETGSCVMCNYGKSHLVSEEDINNLFAIVKKQESRINSILIGTYGSIFDECEIPLNIFNLILEHLNSINISIVIFETHYLTVNEERLTNIRKKLIDKEIAIEMGLESSNKLVLEKCLNKRIDLDLFLQKVALIHDCQMSATANVFLGAPFLSIEEQIEDSLKTINWALKNEIDNVVIFPVNIRKGTLLEFLHSNNRFHRLSYWALYEVVRRIPIDYQSRVYLSWFGDWDDEKIVVNSMSKYDNLLIELFMYYLSLRTGSERLDCLNSFLNDSEVYDDYVKFIRHMAEQSLNIKTNMQDRIEEEHIWICKNMNKCGG